MIKYGALMWLRSSIFADGNFVNSMQNEICTFMKNIKKQKVIVTPIMNNKNTMIIITKPEIQAINDFVRQKGLLYQHLNKLI